jgi:predicted ATP-grasp superfamily ATP-dependent carboligase
VVRVLVPDRLGVATLATVRSLHERGDICDLAAPSSGFERRLRGRAVSEWHCVTSPERDMDHYIDDLVNICRRGAHALLIPLDQLSGYAVALNSSRLTPHVDMVGPGWEAFRMANDKLVMTRHANGIGIPCPELHPVDSESDIEAIAGAARFPVVVKSRAGSASGVVLATDGTELGAACHSILDIGSPTPVEDHSPLVQEFVPGQVHDACAIARDGEVVNILTQVRQRMVPISGGVGAVVVTTDVPEVRRLATRLLESLAWNGPAQIEFKYDERDGTFKFIELNPRLWGTLDASIRAGMDFPGQLRDLALDIPVARDQPYRVGLRYRFLFYRALRAYDQTIRTFGPRRLWADHRSGGAQRTHHDLDWRDPLPDLHRIVTGAPRFARELTRQRRCNERRIPLTLAPRPT